MLRIAFILMIAVGILNHAKAQKLIRFVDPLIGSGDHGHVFVVASVPFGAVQIGPNNIYKGSDSSAIRETNKKANVMRSWSVWWIFIQRWLICSA